MAPPPRAFGLDGEVAIVSGAGSRMEGLSLLAGTILLYCTAHSHRSVGEVGNGRATAILIARQGAKVVLLDLNEEWAAGTKKMIDAEEGESMVVQADVTDEASVRAAVSKAVDAYGKIDILVNIGRCSACYFDVLK